MSKHGENIYKRKDGRWEARYIKRVGLDGRSIWGYVYGQTYNEAKSKRNLKLTEERVAADSRPADMTFAELAESFLEEKRENVKESTYGRYRYLYEKHLKPEFGALKLCCLRSDAAEDQLRAEKKASGNGILAPKTLRDLISLWRLIIRSGVEKKLLPPEITFRARLAEPAVEKSGKVMVMLENDRIKLEKHLMSEHDMRHFGILLALYTGIRIGELCALRWSDIDLKNGILSVNNTIQRLHDYSDGKKSKTKLIISTPKTASSLRKIPLTDFLVGLLKGNEMPPECFILTGNEKPEEPRSYLNFYRKQLKLCGLPRYTFHVTRHTFATRCIESGIDIKTLSEILGHSNIKITMNRYVHPSLESKRHQLEKLAVTG